MFKETRQGAVVRRRRVEGDIAAQVVATRLAVIARATRNLMVMSWFSYMLLSTGDSPLSDSDVMQEENAANARNAAIKVTKLAQLLDLPGSIATKSPGAKCVTPGPTLTTCTHKTSALCVFGRDQQATNLSSRLVAKDLRACGAVNRLR